ncbi:glycosyl hydrolase family 95 catalytic domain-containing protein [Paenibacillus urinalis]|uniref:Alpha-L-fucosidase n=1 Tax=Paenibacillus urinalis TaxID=521520 RepID=A0AAX3MTZ0_9BACL|nr:hypothetical protein [Paenibacillus urinalis]WDH81035.1 hypothetical protein PUW23_16010 [Paenibacillus urinalis]
MVNCRQEWLVDYEEIDPGHRHISHLFALHPGTTISPDYTPDLADAARITLHRRLENGGGHTGWSRAWIINFWARLLDGEQAYYHTRELLKKSTLPNLFDNHPPFQIDGNFGSAAGIAEMLLQSHLNGIRILPALPQAWKQGSVTGLRARGGFTIDIEWEEHKLTNGVITSDHGEKLRIYSDSLIRIASADGSELSAERVGNLLELPTVKGDKYIITAY